MTPIKTLLLAAIAASLVSCASDEYASSDFEGSSRVIAVRPTGTPRSQNVYLAEPSAPSKPRRSFLGHIGAGMLRVSGHTEDEIDAMDRPLFSSSGSSYGSSSYSSNRRSYDTAMTSTPQRPTFSTDYTTSRTLGGNTRISNRYGSSTTFSQNLGGGYSSTSNSGRRTTYTQSLNGGYEARTSRGTTYRTEQTLGGGYRVRGSDGSTTTRTQMLGGGYRYDRF